MKKITFLKKITLSACSLLFLTGVINAQCSANFNYTLGASGSITVESTSTGTNANTSFNWTIGGSGFFNGGPVISYSLPDNKVYTVSLNITDTSTPTPCNSSATKTVAITSAPCFTAAHFYTIAAPNGSINFIPYPTGPSADGYTYSWTFGDGGTSNQFMPVHTYSASGIYTVTLNASTYSAICTYTKTDTVSVAVIPCSLNASYSHTIGNNGKVLFKSSASSTVTNVLHHWDFGDNSQKVLFYPHDTISHTFPGNLNYMVSHTKEFNSPFICKDSVTQPVSVNNMTNCSAFSVFNAQKDLTLPLTWNIFATYPSSVSAVSWDWGDNGTSTGLYPSHTYSAAGWYNVCVSVTVACGSTYSTCTNGYYYRQSAPVQGAPIVVNVKKPDFNTAIQDIKFEKGTISLWPNPNNGTFELQVEGAETNGTYILKIINLLGQPVHSENLKSEGPLLNKSVNINELPAGSYFLQLSSEKSAITTRIIVTK